MIIAFDDSKNPLKFNRKGELVYEDKIIRDLKLPFWKRNRLLKRLLRLEPRVCVFLNDSSFLMAYKRSIYKIDFKLSLIEKVCDSRAGFSDCLNFCRDGNSIFWGDYGNNSSLEKVNIYRFQDNKVNIVYSFPAQSIRHIHNIIYDDYRKGYWILTGDTEKDAGIYFATKDWEVKSILVGEQKYRAVVAFPTPSGLIYATDAVNTDNYIYLLNAENQKIRAITPLNGSCIYGSEIKDKFYFSTTVEPEEGRGFLNLLSYKLGKGIKSRFCQVISIDKKIFEKKIELSLKKDWLPMKLFQYGTVKFPSNQNNLKNIYVTPIATKRFDGNTIKLN